MPTNPRQLKLKLDGTKYGGAATGQPGRVVTWYDLPADSVHRAIGAVTDAGDAMTLGRTSEGGAYYIGIMSGGLLEKFYPSSPQECEDALRGFVEVAEG